MAEHIEEAKTLYGRRKLSAEAYAKQSAEKTKSARGGTKYGKRKDSPAAAPSTPSRPSSTPPAGGQGTGTTTPPKPAGPVSIEKLTKALDKNPDLLDAAIAEEFKQPKPRKGAIALFIETEKARKGGPRADVLAQLGVEPGTE